MKKITDLRGMPPIDMIEKSTRQGKDSVGMKFSKRGSIASKLNQSKTDYEIERGENIMRNAPILGLNGERLTRKMDKTEEKKEEKKKDEPQKKPPTQAIVKKSEPKPIKPVEPVVKPKPAKPVKLPLEERLRKPPSEKDI